MLHPPIENTRETGQVRPSTHKKGMDKLFSKTSWTPKREAFTIAKTVHIYMFLVTGVGQTN